MSVLGSVEALIAGSTTGFVGYPIKYHLDPEPEKSFVDGVDRAGKPFRLFLTVPEHFIEKAKLKTDISVPVLKKLAGRKGNICEASDDNGPVSMTGGCFMAEQVTIIDKENRILKANWLSVLREDFEAAAPHIGVGYMEMNIQLPSAKADVEELKIKLQAMNISCADAIDAERDEIDGISLVDYIQMRNQVYGDLVSKMSRAWFIGVEMQCQRIVNMDKSNAALARREILEIIESNSNNGCYGGVILRPVITKSNGDRIVLTKDIKRLNHQYKYSKPAGVPDVSTVWDEFLNYGGSGWLGAMSRSDCEVEIIPIRRTNAGKITNEKLSEDLRKERAPKFVKAFVDSRFHTHPYLNLSAQNAFLATPVAMRIAKVVEGAAAGNLLLSSMHSFGKAIGNSLLLDKNFTPTLMLDTPLRPRHKRASAPAQTPTPA